MSNYPPGVTGNEPQITGEWPCAFCDGAGGWMEDEGPDACPLCKGTGIHPEDAWEFTDIMVTFAEFFKRNNYGGLYIEEDGDGFLTLNTSLRLFGTTVVSRAE
jgi:DnaJ-class molecular chaperone